MAIKLKRNTGMMGGATRITVKADNEKLTSLKQNEEKHIDLPKDKTQITANQWFFGSKPTSVKDGDNVKVRMNNYALLLYILSMIALFTGLFTSNLILLIIGILLIFITMIYAIKNWFVVNVK
ncbi:hypothetical protein ACFQ4N_14415 [Oceanobacillus iheyensis]|uniref:Uncharacterized protein n=1 Tax=Oceanobacillus iheyensis (strain DSM 14371 / CIP 107618 / JCM 11309 / KCTC 3954 / HTE831) TaxID=221109 RepID=Q8ET86_OCEIH|nr:hypothetical protein [Oceanobacillus iheyensis]BAC12332.1 hypothetical protein [Oceanobacillus iheyensis HTE831]